MSSPNRGARRDRTLCRYSTARTSHRHFLFFFGKYSCDFTLVPKIEGARSGRNPGGGFGFGHERYDIFDVHVGEALAGVDDLAISLVP